MDNQEFIYYFLNISEMYQIKRSGRKADVASNHSFLDEEYKVLDSSQTII